MSSPRGLYNSVASDVEYELSRRFMNYAGQQLIHKQNLIIMESNLLIERLGRIQFKKNNESFQSDFCHFATLNTLDTSITEFNDIPRIRKVFTRKNNNTGAINKKSINDQSLNDCLLQIKKQCSSNTYEFIRNLSQKYEKQKKNESQNKASQQLNMSLNGIIKSRCQTDRNNHDQVLILNIKNQKLQKQNGMLSAKIKQLQKKIHQQELLMTQDSKIQKKKLQTKKIKNLEYGSEINDLGSIIKANSQKIEQSHNSIISLLQNTFIDQGCNRCCVLIKKIKGSLINYRNNLTQEMEVCNNLWEKLQLSLKINI